MLIVDCVHVVFLSNSCRSLLVLWLFLLRRPHTPLAVLRYHCHAGHLLLENVGRTTTSGTPCTTVWEECAASFTSFGV